MDEGSSLRGHNVGGAPLGRYKTFGGEAGSERGIRPVPSFEMRKIRRVMSWSTEQQRLEVHTCLALSLLRGDACSDGLAGPERFVRLFGQHRGDSGGNRGRRAEHMVDTAAAYGALHSKLQVGCFALLAPCLHHIA